VRKKVLSVEGNDCDVKIVFVYLFVEIKFVEYSLNNKEN